MRTLYGSTSWRRVLALVLVFVMMVSTMGTSGYSVFADDLTETGEEVTVAEPEAIVPEVTEDIQGPSPGEEVATDAELVEASEDGEEPVEEVAEPAEATEEGEEPAEEVAEPVEATEEGEEPADAEPVEETEEGEEPVDAETVEETEEAEPVEPAEETLISEAAKVIEGDDGEAVAEPVEATEESSEEAVEELPEEVIPVGTTSFEPVAFEDAIVTIAAEPYTFPEDTTVTVKEVNFGRTLMSAIKGAVADAVPIKAYDITFYDADGNEIQPAKPVKISVESVDLPEMDNLQILHIEDKSNKADVVEGVETTESGFEFDAAHFSIYVIVDGENTTTFHRTYKFEDIDSNGEYVSYKFYNKAGKLVDQQILKNGDELEPVGTPYHSSYDFLGWYLWNDSEWGEQVTFGETVAMDLTEDEEVVVRARYGGVYYIHFYENAYGSEEQIVLTTCVVPAEESYPINNIKAPIPSAGTIFIGWRIADDKTLLESPYVPTSDINLYPVFTPGFWLRFDGNGTGASYTEAISVSTVTDLSSVTKPSDPTRQGYTFAGWFTTADGDDEFAWSGKLSADKVVYAHWTPEDVSYSVFYWLENADDEDYTFLTSKTLEGTAGKNTAAAALTASEQNGFPNINWDGFLYQEPEQTTINGDGSTIVNVFYDRKIVTLTFHKSKNTTYTPDNNGEYYKVTRRGGNDRTSYYFKSGTGDDDYTNLNTAIGENIYFAYPDEGPRAYSSSDTITLYTRRWRGGLIFGYWEYSVANNVSGVITRYSMSGEGVETIVAKYGADIHDQWPTNPAGETKWYLDQNGSRWSVMINTMPVSDTNYYYIAGGGDYILQTEYRTQDLDNLNSFSVYQLVGYKGNRSVYKTADDYTGILGFSINAYSASDAETIRQDDKGDQNATYNASYPRSPRIETSYGEGVREGNTYTLTFYYLRNQYDIEFISNGKIVDSEKDIYYEADISDKIPVDFIIDETESVINGNNCVFKGWYDNAECEGNPYTFNTMPAGNLTLYAKWEKAWYIISVDPNGGVLNGGDPSVTTQATWFWEEFGEKVTKYDTTRNFVADPEGTYYYHKSINPNDSTIDRLAYYTTDPELSTDGGKTYKPEEGVYVFEGWYRLDANGNPESEPYDFEEPVRGAFTIQAQWRKTGAYTLAYQGIVDGIGGNADALQDTASYADKAVITIPGAPSGITPMYVFDGWFVVDADGKAVDDNIYKPGDELTLNAEWADAHKVIHIQAHYTKVDESTDPVGITKLILNANGGIAEPNANYTFTDANGHEATPTVADGVVSYVNLPLNQAFNLAAVNDNFKRDGYALIGWNTEKAAADNGTVLYDKTFTIGMDNERPDSNTLYAVWEKVETYTVVYTDGVEGAVIFADQTTGGLIVGEDTPKFTGSLKRENYVFVAWDPTFNATIAAKDADANNTITYTATWKDDKNATDKPDDEEEYTVEYKKGEHGAFTEGVAGKTTFTELALNAPTPSYAGEVDSKQNPLGAKDYAFDGWDKTISRTILAEDCATGTCVITYIAKWADDKNNNDIPDKNEYFTVVYTDGVENEEVFADQSHPELLVGTDTPAFNGTPTRSGYTFTEWTPSKQDKVRAEDADEDNVITYTAQWTAKETPTVEYTILYNSNYSTYSSLADIEKLDGPAASLTILSPDDAKLGFAEKVGSDPIWTNGDQRFKFNGWSLQSAKGSAIYEGTTYPETATTPAGQDDAGNATIIDPQPMNPRPAGASSLATLTVLRTLTMAATSSEDGTPDLTLYAQWEEVVEPVEPNPHMTVTKTVDPEPAADKKFALDEEIVYKITVTNDGNVELGDIKVTDTLNVTVAEGESLEIKSLQPGESKTITVTYKVTQEDINRGSITNGATAEGKIPGSTEDIPVTPGEVTVSTNKPNDGGNTPGGNGGTNPRPSNPDPVDPTDEPEEPIDDPDTPLAPGTTDEPEEPIDDPDTPLAPYEEETEIDDEATPLTPFTGDDRHTDVWAFLSVLSLAGIVLLGRKRREEE